MFWNKRKPDLTNEAYERWLRAQRPPFDWFLALSQVEQEQLAILGDAQMQDLAVALGYAIRDPEAADAGMSAMNGDTGAEATLATKLAQGFAEKLMSMQQHAQAPQQTSARTMSGFGDRQRQEENRPAEASLWGVEASEA
jgi:hypothetical protein